MRSSSTRALGMSLALRPRVFPAPIALLTPTSSSQLGRWPTRSLHTPPAAQAQVGPMCGTGPPPDPPVPEVPPAGATPLERVARRRKQMDMLARARDMRGGMGGKKGEGGGMGEGMGLKRRFWRDVGVQRVDDALQISLDTRPLRHPTTKSIIRLPPSKPALASALALEWDLLTSAADATRHHLVPLTSLVCRALDIAESDTNPNAPRIRDEITTTVLRYLDTDTLLCLAPESPTDANSFEGSATSTSGYSEGTEGRGESLRELQLAAATPIINHLTTHLWPGASLAPVLNASAADTHSLLPTPLPANTLTIVKGWVSRLSAWELAGLERACLAGKGLLGAARLVSEWSEEGAGVVGEWRGDSGEVFGVEEAARASSVEVDWQTGKWGAVEDTHDVEREDLRRQLGAVVLLVSGDGGR